ncbi:class I SAM-dependent methyltransferase [Truepera radiovictrix]|uniref:Methyltransferase type 11 n=1 Tax=Truepera radiovictrix (strain DSM 17093 / CIP 108686 / LMG 22925 / RQ-24) TaxID=649638 RepID=D7CU35_TRURR|nr:class I SAM-dependent methyltransferase [Truepera radiovictrix]ADI13933.1 Methyltransferase type 11 [Truepera radiovictrix DSM 17093]WMT57502.1 class I SAM-dependent methyltransferase [Truepera radiovictrix]
MSEKRFRGAADRLRRPERLALLEPARVCAHLLGSLRAPSGAPSVLDIGTGTGVFAEAFAAAGASVTGVDLNPDFLALAAAHVPAATFVRAAGEALPFGAARFDLAFLGHVLHESDAPEAMLAEAARVAREVAVLEWPYRDEAQGPPLAHRLSEAALEAASARAALAVVERLELQHMRLYRLRHAGP